MPPMPPGPNAAEILQGLWEETLEPADLTRRSLELGKLSSQLVATSQDGHVASVQLLNYGQGDLAEVISSSWVRYFAQVGIVAGQAGEASACLSGWATTLGAMLQAMAGVVAQAEAMIKLFESARPIMESFGIDVDAEIQAIKEAAQEDVRAISAAAMGGLAAVPSWAGQIPAGLSMPGGQGASTPTGVDNAPGTPAGQSTTSTTGIDNAPGTPAATPASSPTGVDQPPGTAAATPASNTTGIDNAPGTAAATPAGNALGGGGGIDNAPGTSAPGASTSPGGMSPSSGSSPVSGSPTNPSASPSAGSSTPSAAPSGGAGGSPTPAGSGGSAGQSGDTSSPAGSGSSSSPSPAAAPAHSAAPESAPVSTASGHTSGGAAPAVATPLSPSAGVAPVSNVVASSAAAAAGVPTSAGLPPVSAAASPIASAAAGAVPAPPPVPPVSPLSPVSPGSALAPPPVSAPPPAPAPVHAPAVSGPAPGASPPPPASPNPGGSSAPPAAASPHVPTAPVSQSSGQQDGPADRSGAPIVPLSSAHDPLIAPAAFVTPPIVFTPPADNEDLAAVRITVEAVGGGDHVQWAAGMVAVSGSKKLVVTSDRGRGWMPSNAVLPASVELPWRHPDATRWEGLIDPARVIVEYAAAVGGALTALASTMFSPPSVVANVPFAFVDSTERAHPELLTSPILRGPTATRLELQISAGLRKKASVFTTDIEQRQQALGCANAAHLDAERLSGDVWRSDTRRRLFDVLRQRQTAAPARIVELGPLWDELKDEWLTLRDLEHAARLDVRDVAIGQLDNSGSDCLPYLVQGYATEAALGLFTASSAGAFSHALYHWGMLRDYVTAADVVPS